MSTMRAMVYQRYGPAEEVLEMVDLPVPSPGAREVLIRVRASAVSPGDWFALHGTPYVFRVMTGLTRPRHRVLGLVVVGTIEKVGTGVTEFQPGDVVYAEIPHGGFAEYARVAATAAAHVPSTLTMEEAAAVPLVGVTALQAIRDVAKVKPGQRVLVTGASGGVGSMAVQIARRFGAHVTGVCSTAHVELVRALGADEVIDYTQQDFTSSGQHWDVILDNVGNHTVADLRRALTPRGMLIPSANSGGPVFGVLLRILQSLAITAFVRQRLRPFAARARAADLATLTSMIEDGTLIPVVDSTYALADAAKALSHYGQGHSRGKVVIAIG